MNNKRVEKKTMYREKKGGNGRRWKRKEEGREERRNQKGIKRVILKITKNQEKEGRLNRSVRGQKGKYNKRME